MADGFQQATAVERIGELHYAGRVHDGWDIGGNANGGYVLAIAGRAMADVAGRPPLTVTGHYLAPVPPGPCEVDVEPVRIGRRLSTLGASLHQGDHEALRVLGTFGVAHPSDITYVAGGPPDVPPYDECVPSGDPSDPQLPAITRQLANRLRPGDDGFRRGAPTGRAELEGWFALADDEPIDAIGLLLAADAMPPAVFNTDLPVAWVPTVELTVHVRAAPAPGPLRCRFASRFVTGGLLEEDGELWDATGTLVAQSRQLALTPR